jgi:uncharacterized HAD superfamily protein
VIICTDLDATITKDDSGFTPQYWNHREPDKDYIEILRRARKEGHKIIIHTSRLSSEARIGTIEWLEKHKVPYDAIHFDKPFYDVLIDDKLCFKRELEDILDGKVVPTRLRL